MEHPKSLGPSISPILCVQADIYPPPYLTHINYFLHKTCRYVFLIFIICLVSPWHFTAVAQNVVFPDANLAAKVRSALGLAPDADILLTDLQGLALFFAPDSEITDLTGLEKATGLISLQIYDNPIRDFTPISSLTNLTNLNLRNTGFSNADFTILSPLTNLQALLLGQNEITDITNLPQLPNLRSLHMWDNQITDISRITTALDATEMRLFNLRFNQIRDITPLGTFTNVTELDLGNNRIRDITPLRNLTKLSSRLRIYRNEISDISALSPLTELTDLWMHHNQVRDLSPLANLTELRTLVICYNRYTDISPLKNLVNLQLFYIDLAFEEAYRDLVGEMLPRTFQLCAPLPEPEPEPESELESDQEPESEWEPKIKRRRSTTRCGLGWSPQAQYQPWEELYKVMIYALEFEYDPEGHQKFICKTIEIRTGDDAIENLAGWKLYLGTRYNPSYIPLTIPEEHGQITGRILRLTPEMFGREAFPCNTVNTISHPLPGVRYDLKTDENVLVDIAYSCFIWGQIAYTTVNGQNVESPRRISSAALREMEAPRLERYIPNTTGIYITYMDLEAFTWDRVVLSDWLLPPSATSVAGAPSSFQRNPATTWGTLKKQ